MSGQASIGHISEREFSSVLQALSSGPKGRSFLAEYRRRARPDETMTLLESLGRIEATIGTVRDQLQPERIADELRHIAMTLEIAIEGAAMDANGDEAARRMALVDRCRCELTTLAVSLCRDLAPSAQPPGGREADPAEPDDLRSIDDLALLD